MALLFIKQESGCPPLSNHIYKMFSEQHLAIHILHAASIIEVGILHIFWLLLANAKQYVQLNCFSS